MTVQECAVEREGFCGGPRADDRLMVAFRHGAGDLMVRVWSGNVRNRDVGTQNLSIVLPEAIGRSALQFTEEGSVSVSDQVVLRSSVAVLG
jgi:hypothetical protein